MGRFLPLVIPGSLKERSKTVLHINVSCTLHCPAWRYSTATTCQRYGIITSSSSQHYVSHTHLVSTFPPSGLPFRRWSRLPSHTPVSWISTVPDLCFRIGLVPEGLQRPTFATWQSDPPLPSPRFSMSRSFFRSVLACGEGAQGRIIVRHEGIGGGTPIATTVLFPPQQPQAVSPPRRTLDGNMPAGSKIAHKTRFLCVPGVMQGE